MPTQMWLTQCSPDKMIMCFCHMFDINFEEVSFVTEKHFIRYVIHDMKLKVCYEKPQHQYHCLQLILFQVINLCCKKHWNVVIDGVSFAKT